jgi:hypothetical protein
MQIYECTLQNLFKKEYNTKMSVHKNTKFTGRSAVESVI